MTTPLVRLVRQDGTIDVPVGYVQGGNPLIMWVEEDSPGAGTHTYRIQIAEQAGSSGTGGHSGMLSGSMVAAVIKR
jgi:hypothetical protein